MKLAVRLFAAARQLAQTDSLEIECPPEATVADVRQALASACPSLAPLLPHVRFAINADYAKDDSPVPENGEIACIPPVSGG